MTTVLISHVCITMYVTSSTLYMTWKLKHFWFPHIRVGFYYTLIVRMESVILCSRITNVEIYWLLYGILLILILISLFKRITCIGFFTC